MIFMKTLTDNIADTEYLYRGILDIWIDKEHNRITSAAFKDSLGVSVDRQADRQDEQCIQTLKSKSSKFVCVCKLLTKEVRQSEMFVKYCPSNSNIYHSEIHDSETQVRITSQSKARRLSTLAQICE